MPTIDVSLKDFRKLLGKTLSRDELAEALMYAKGELDGVEGDAAKLDMKDTNRPDLWGPEGVARELRARLGMEKGLPAIKAGKSGVTLYLEKSVQKVRPLCYAAIVKDVKFSDELLASMIGLQEKMNQTHGRKRRECGIGLYDFNQMTPPVYYRGYKPHELKFAPLDFDEEMYLDEILEKHPKGIEFGHLVKESKQYPIIIDDAGVVGSMPPIINSNHVGRVTEKTRNIFIECTGFKHDTVMTELLVASWALAARGGSIETVDVVLQNGKRIVSPDFAPKKLSFEKAAVSKMAGVKFSDKQLLSLLGRARYNARIAGKKLHVEYPSYREDILHPVDVIEDVLISYGYNNFEPCGDALPVRGWEHAAAREADLVREVCVGLGCQEVLTFVLASRETQEGKVGLKGEAFMELANPVSLNWGLMRKRLYPQALEFLSKNKDASYPQRVFEVGKTVEPDDGTETRARERDKVCVALAGGNANYTHAKSALDALARHLGLSLSLAPHKEAAFVDGKCARITHDGKGGVIGEVAETTLQRFGLKQPVALFELEY